MNNKTPQSTPLDKVVGGSSHPNTLQRGYQTNDGHKVQGGHQPATNQTKPAGPPPNQGSGGKK